MSEANPRQSLVKGERLIRYELASAITRLRRSCAKRTFTWGQRSGRKSAANGWTWSKTTGVSQNTQRQSTTTRRPATWLNETTHNRNRINKKLLLTHHLKIKNVNYIGDVTSPMQPMFSVFLCFFVFVPPKGFAPMPKVPGLGTNRAPT